MLKAGCSFGFRQRSALHGTEDLFDWPGWGKWGHFGRMETRLIICRHGETVWNAQERFQGQTDSELSPAGWEQARALAGRLGGERVDAIYSSDLQRAANMAQLIGEKTGAPVKLDARLRERHLGCLEGLTRAEAKVQVAEDFARYYSGEMDFAPSKGGESFRTCQERAVGVFQEIAAGHKGETVVAITHGALMGAFLRQVLGIGVDAPSRFARPNAGYNVFTHDGKVFQMVTWGDVTHLKAG